MVQPLGADHLVTQLRSVLSEQSHGGGPRVLRRAEVNRQGDLSPTMIYPCPEPRPQRCSQPGGKTPWSADDRTGRVLGLDGRIRSLTKTVRVESRIRSCTSKRICTKPLLGRKQ